MVFDAFLLLDCRSCQRGRGANHSGLLLRRNVAPSFLLLLKSPGSRRENGRFLKILGNVRGLLDLGFLDWRRKIG